ncbi:hypothetical protein SI65_08060 [Aspergillus cristatus]|uniref:Uncharacterized protein n=1 Tax=Aspergillus cristatus TaxID=573508 RepID=A0A1E3B6G9_ASPCR|nr:hypothetical protein SI65_08060 [Aspergillus cristatus]
MGDINKASGNPLLFALNILTRNVLHDSTDLNLTTLGLGNHNDEFLLESTARAEERPLTSTLTMSTLGQGP